MDALEAILTRRSCRSYTSRQIEPAVLDKIIEAGRYAPSGMGRQPWRFVVLRDADEISRLSEMNARIMGVSSDPFYGAPTVIVVLVDPSVPTCVEDGALALGNMMVAAQALGVSSCWIHRAKEEFESDEGKALLGKWGVEGTWRGVGHCVLGYPSKDPAEPKPRREGVVTYVG
jgi:nitroreductase